LLWAEIAALHSAQLAELTEAVGDLGDGAGMDPQAPNGPHRPIVWSRLTGVDLERIWTALADVGVARGRFPVANQVPYVGGARSSSRSAPPSGSRGATRTSSGVHRSRPAPTGMRGACPKLLRRIRAGGWNIACEEHRSSVESLTTPECRRARRVAGRIGAPTTSKPPITEGEVKDVEEMKAALQAGAATRLGELPDSPIELSGELWCMDGASWGCVVSPEVAAYLTDAQRRLVIAREVDGEGDAR
jgi:hypothetical protein